VQKRLGPKPIHSPFRLWTRVGRRMHKFNRIRQVAPMCPCGRTPCRHLSNNIEHPCTAAMRLMANYFDHLLPLDTTTYTVAQIAKRFEPSTVLWAFHTIQPSSFILWLLLLLSFFPRLISAVGDWMSTILPHMVWPYSVNLECRSENVLLAAR